MFDEHPHRRRNVLTGEWILVSPQRTRRPWLGRSEEPRAEIRPPYDPDCYLCPGNERSDGNRNPDYAGTWVFTNDFPALVPSAPAFAGSPDPLFCAAPERGTCRVVCFSPRHDLTLPEMKTQDIRRVIDAWSAESAELGRRHRWVQVFENKGEAMGCSNPHPHGQIWAGSALPDGPGKEDRQQKLWYRRTGAPLLAQYLARELEREERVVLENREWVAVVPFWALWPFETLLIPRRHVLRLCELSAEEGDALADVLKRLLSKYDNLFETSFPYSMGWHGAPTGPGVHRRDFSHWQLHAHFYPPLLRSATVKKFMVGYEMLGEPQRDQTPEHAAEKLRSLPDIHYKERTRQGL